MAFWNRKKTQEPIRKAVKQVGARFFGRDTHRLLHNWTTSTAPIDLLLTRSLTTIRARSRELVQQNSHIKRYIRAVTTNVVGANGPMLQSMVMKSGGEDADHRMRKAVEMVWKDWCRKKHCDRHGRLSFRRMMSLCIKTAAQDGEFILRVHDSGKYGLQLEVIDPELMDVKHNIARTAYGGSIRLGVERDAAGMVTGYWFREPKSIQNAGYSAGKLYRIPADQIIHCFDIWWPNQSRGVPWTHAGLRDCKTLEEFDSAAMSAARAGAMAAFALTNKDSVIGAEQYTGDETDDLGNSIQTLEAGTIMDFGDKQLSPIDPEYPQEFYPDFVAAQLRKLSRGLGISYHTMSGDLSSVNFSSIRADILEDREIYMEQQVWMEEECYTEIWERFIERIFLMGHLTMDGRSPSRPIEDFLPMTVQHKRWAWIEPLKEVQANEKAIEQRLKTRGQVIQEQGDDPDALWERFAAEEARLKELNIEVKTKEDKQMEMAKQKQDNSDSAGSDDGDS